MFQNSVINYVSNTHTLNPVAIFLVYVCSCVYVCADPSGRAVQDVGIRPSACWDREFESHWGHGCLCCLLYKDNNMEDKWHEEGGNDSKDTITNWTRKKSQRGHGCLSVVSVACCQEEVAATCWSLVQRNPIEYDVCECDVLRCDTV
jgi:hypothetical protein